MTDPVRPLAYTVKDAAAALAIGENLLHRAMGHNMIRYTRIGRILRIPASEVERVAAEGLPQVPRNYIRRTTGPTRIGKKKKS